MKMSILNAGLAAPHAGWAAIDELALLLARYFGAELLAPALRPRSAAERWTANLLSSSPAPRHEPVETAGGDVLFVVAHGPDDLRLIESIPNVRRRFGQIHAWVTDSYFQAGFGRITGRYDSITVTAAEDVQPLKDRHGIPVHHVYQGIDGLAWLPRHTHARDIDVIAYGRTPPSYHAALIDRFHRPDSRELYLHSPIGHLSGPTVHQERAMLFKLLHRTQVALAFHLFVEPVHDRPRAMMVTSRWLESLLCGCIVAGKRPVSRMADDMLSWPGATVELPDDPRLAVDALTELLERRTTLDRQRRSNMRHTLQQHDWRHRILTLCGLFGWPVPPALTNDLTEVERLAQTLA